MRPFNIGLGIIAAGFALAATPAFAQRPNESGSPPAERAVERTSGNASSGNSGGNATAATSAGSAASTTSSSSSASSSPSSSLISSPGFGGAGGHPAYRAEAPQHRGGGSGSGGGGGQHPSSGSAAPRSGGRESGGANQGDHAVPRSNPTASAPTGTSRTNAASAPSSNQVGNDRAVPTWARPRGDRPVTDTAVPRTVPRGSGDGTYVVSPDYYYDPYFRFYYPGLYSYYPGYGLYGYYNPFDPRYPFFGDPFSLGYGFGLGVPTMYDPYPFGGGAGGDDYYSRQDQGTDDGHLRLKVKPRSAKVYVDGLFIGTVDDMDGMFQKFPLPIGRHRIEVKADGYEPQAFDAIVSAHETVTFEGNLKKIQ